MAKQSLERLPITLIPGPLVQLQQQQKTDKEKKIVQASVTIKMGPRILKSHGQTKFKTDFNMCDYFL